MATSMITSPLVAPARAKGLPSISRRGSSFAIVCSGGKKIKTDKPYGIGGGMSVDIDASGRKSTGKGVYQFVDKYGANVDGYSPIYSPEEWSPTGDTYVGVVGTKSDRVLSATCDVMESSYTLEIIKEPPGF
ncbi:hypothetical protein DAI22_08g064000 [Oryza sativa Japonica Group]|nr:hypothetical protein DAI22_08g064000 [Oryza sativa Japonica Group]